ncbi:MAG: hypothetical protein LQ340_007608, partial [Diploschistes diacapsis]
MAEIASGMLVCNMPYLPRLFNQSSDAAEVRGKLSSYWSRRIPGYGGNSRYHRKDYSEVDGYPLNSVNGIPGPSAETVVGGNAEVTGAAEFDGLDDSANAGDGILKTISIQHSAAQRGTRRDQPAIFKK